jgi:hypothetical protein
VRRRDALARRLDVTVVPYLASGRFALSDLVALLGESRVGTGPAEGVYIRREEGDHLVARAKLVRPEFVQAIGAHWSRGPLRTNVLATAASP